MDAKRIFDIAGSLAALTISGPVMLACAGVSATLYRGRAFHAVERSGKDGTSFKMFKLKRMADLKDESGAILPDEQREGLWGRFLQATSFDELPQFINVLKGDMSLVGPRPYAKGRIPDGYEDILKVKPGITGPWQVASIGRATKMPGERRLNIELAYAKEAPSLKRDMLMVCKTPSTFFLGHDGATLVSNSGQDPRPT